MMKNKKATLYTSEDANLESLQGTTIAVIGYGNQGRAQALNLRDSGARVIIGNRQDRYSDRARADGFQVHEISTAVIQAEIVLLLLPDEVLPGVFEANIKPYLKPNSTLVFASGYNVAFNHITLPTDVDAVLLAPRMIGVGVRERYLNQEGFYCFVGIEQNASGIAKQRLLTLTMAISRLIKPAIEVTFKQESLLDLFNEQAFGPAFGRVLLTAISVLLANGLPPEAVLVEMYMSEEMAYTYKKMAQFGLIRQTAFHSPTSQYGAMSRGTRFLGMDLKRRMNQIYKEIDNGDFAREWSSPIAKLRYKIIKNLAIRQSINKIERQVRKSLGMKAYEESALTPELSEILKNPDIQKELNSFEETFEF
jgi:ketol-acid reductoisomerase